MFTMTGIPKVTKERLIKLSKEKDVSQAGILCILINILEASESGSSCDYGKLKYIDWEKAKKEFPRKYDDKTTWKERTEVMRKVLGSYNSPRINHKQLIALMQEELPDFRDGLLPSLLFHEWKSGNLPEVKAPCVTYKPSTLSFQKEVQILIESEKLWKRIEEKLS